jgi:hypothetical protein
MTKLQKLIAGLQIIAQLEPDTEIAISDGMLSLGNTTKYTEEQINQLDILGFEEDTYSDSFEFYI